MLIRSVVHQVPDRDYNTVLLKHLQAMSAHYANHRLAAGVTESAAAMATAVTTTMRENALLNLALVLRIQREILIGQCTQGTNINRLI